MLHNLICCDFIQSGHLNEPLLAVVSEGMGEEVHRETCSTPPSVTTCGFPVMLSGLHSVFSYTSCIVLTKQFIILYITLVTGVVTLLVLSWKGPIQYAEFLFGAFMFMELEEFSGFDSQSPRGNSNCTDIV